MGGGDHVMWSKLYLQFSDSGVIFGKWQEVTPPKALPASTKTKLFMEMALCQPDENWKTKGQRTPGPIPTRLSFFSG